MSAVPSHFYLPGNQETGTSVGITQRFFQAGQHKLPFWTPGADEIFGARICTRDGDAVIHTSFEASRKEMLSGASLLDIAVQELQQRVENIRKAKTRIICRVHLELMDSGHLSHTESDKDVIGQMSKFPDEHNEFTKLSTRAQQLSTVIKEIKESAPAAQIRGFLSLGRHVSRSEIKSSIQLTEGLEAKVIPGGPSG